MTGLVNTAKFTGILAFVGAIGWFVVQNQIHSKLRETVETELNESLAESGIETTIGNAQFWDREGLLLSNVTARTGDISLTAYETFLAMPSHSTELVMGSFAVEGITMRRLQLEVVRRANRNFDFAEIIETINSALAKRPCSKLIPITLEDSRIHVVDEVSGVEKTISDIGISIKPIVHDGREILQVDVSAATAEIQQLLLSGYVDPVSGQWNCQLDLNSAIIRSDLIAILPRELQRLLRPIRSLTARIDGTISATGNFRDGSVRAYEGNGIVSQFTIDDQRLPSVIQNGVARFHITPDGITLSEIAGYLGRSAFAAHYYQSGLLHISDWQLNGRLNKFHFDGSQRILDTLPEGGKRFAHDFQPRGIFDFQFDIRFDGKEIRKTVETKVSELSFLFNKFPYPVSGCIGDARWIDDQITYDLRCPKRNYELSARGTVDNPGLGATWQCDLKVENGNLPFDEPLMTAIDANPALAKVIRAFRADGRIRGSGTLKKPIPHGEVHKEFDIELVDIRMRHEKFPYSIEGVRGRIKSINKSFSFEELTGSNGIGQILCNGRWNPEEGLRARYICNNIRLDDRLRTALKPKLKEVWDGFRPRGTVAMMTVDMALPVGASDSNLVLDATLHGELNGIRKSNLSIYPTWFPYELNDLAGRIQVGNGKIRLTDFRGRHGRTTVDCKGGEGSYSGEGWDMRLSDLLTTSLKVDEPLMSALPDSLARPIEAMKVEGSLNVQGTMTLAGHYRKPATQFASRIPGQIQTQKRTKSFVQRSNATAEISERSVQPNVSMGWDLQFNMDQTKLFLGIPVDNVFGILQLIGQYDGQNVECRGTVDIDSLTIYDAQITNLRGPVWFDNVQALAGGMINQLPTGSNQTPSIEGEMYGGTVRLDAAMSSDREGRFAIQTSLAGGNLKQFCNEFSPNLEDIEGLAFVGLRMQGDASGVDSCRGDGVVQLRDAKIYELPPVLKLLNLVNIRRVNDVAFDKGDVSFVVNGENIDINRMEFNGDAVSLIGNGRITMDHDLDLNFYSVMGRNRLRIPLLHELYHLSSQKFFWISVGGTSQNPTIERKILPELNESMKQLFQQTSER